MKENHSVELLFNADRACKDRMDVVSMALMEIYWNRNHCINLLNKMISCCGREDNILACNQMMLLSSVDMLSMLVRVEWMWCRWRQWQSIGTVTIVLISLTG